MSFETLYKKYSEKYVLKEQPEDTPPPTPAPDPGGAMPTVDAGGGQPPIQEPPKPLTPEGKRYVIDVARKALLWPTDQVPTNIQSELANNEVTPENAEEVLELIERVVGEDIPRAEEA